MGKDTCKNYFVSSDDLLLLPLSADEADVGETISQLPQAGPQVEPRVQSEQRKCLNSIF